MRYLAGAELGHTGGGRGLSHGDSAAERCATRASVQRPACRWLPGSQPRPLPSVSQLWFHLLLLLLLIWGRLRRPPCSSGRLLGWLERCFQARVAAVLHTQNGLSLRVAAIYGPVGACLPDFGVRHASSLHDEQALKEFLDTQIRKAAEHQQLLIVGGDLNSFVSQELDCWEGTCSVRPASLAPFLQARGFLDMFRVRHPRLKAFTFFSRAGSASRLDSIWWLPCPSLEVHLLNASILWKWDRRVDHDPVLADLALQLPAVPDTSPPARPWRNLVSRLDTDLPSVISSRAAQHTARLSQLASALSSLEEEWRALPQPPCEGLDGFHGLPSLTPPESFTERVQSTVDGVMSVLMAVLPAVHPTHPVPERQLGRQAEAWHACLLELRRVRTAVRDALPSSRHSLNLARFPLSTAATLWSKAVDMENHARQDGAVDRPGLPAWDLFLRDRVEWASSLGFDSSVAPLAAALDDEQPRLAGNVSFRWPPAPTWTSSPPSPSPAQCLQLLDDSIAEAAKRQSAVAQSSVRSSRQLRISLLRRGDAKGWASRMRPASLPQARYSPEWVADADGSRRRPCSTGDVLQGATQEWSRLLQQPPQPWQHASTLSFTDGNGARRGAIDFLQVGASHPNSDLSRVGLAMLSPGPRRLISFSCRGQCELCAPAMLARSHRHRCVAPKA